MSDKNFGPTIEKCPHDKEHPYTMVLNSLVRDNSISPNCRSILIYLLSHKAGWRISTSQIYHEFKDHLGRDKILRILDEAINAGYMKREDYKEGNLRRCRYFLSEIPKFKKILPRPDFKGPEEKGVIEDEVFLEKTSNQEQQTSSSKNDDDDEKKELSFTKDQFKELIIKLDEHDMKEISSNEQALFKLCKRHGLREVKSSLKKFINMPGKKSIINPFGWLFCDLEEKENYMKELESL